MSFLESTCAAIGSNLQILIERGYNIEIEYSDNEIECISLRLTSSLSAFDLISWSNNEVKLVGGSVNDLEEIVYIPSGDLEIFELINNALNWLLARC